MIISYLVECINFAQFFSIKRIGNEVCDYDKNFLLILLLEIKLFTKAAHSNLFF